MAIYEITQKKQTGLLPPNEPRRKYRYNDDTDSDVEFDDGCSNYSFTTNDDCFHECIPEKGVHIHGYSPSEDDLEDETEGVSTMELDDELKEDEFLECKLPDSVYFYKDDNDKKKGTIYKERTTAYAY